MDAPSHIGMGLLFYPRGGSAQVARYLAAALQRAGTRVTLATGSLGESGSAGHAGTFFAGLDTVALPYDDAVAAWRDGGDPVAATPPMHPSYEPKPGVPDRCFGLVSPELGEHLERAWRDLLAATPDWHAAQLLHLHHLTPIHAAAASIAPATPRITNLHGTDLAFVEAALRGDEAFGEHARWWADRFIAHARAAAATICISPHERDKAAALLGIDPASIELVPNGVDVELFADAREGMPGAMVDEERLACWTRWLAQEPLGWSEQEPEPGSVRVEAGQVRRAFLDDDGALRPVLLFVGRFLGMKRVPMLVRAYDRARREHGVTAPLVIWGGSPGEWEGEHPVTVARDAGLLGDEPSVFFVGWRGHDELPTGLAAADVFVAPSSNEPFGQVYLEAMGCGRPVIGTLSGGPPSFVNVVPGEPDGWLVPPDDEHALAAAIGVACLDAGEREARGANAARHVREAWSWDGIAVRVQELYARVLGDP